MFQNHKFQAKKMFFENIFPHVIVSHDDHMQKVSPWVSYSELS